MSHMENRQLTPLDHLLSQADQALRTMFGGPPPASRENPAADNQSELSEADRQHVAGLMRINHAGEIAAQALYQGQALTARLEVVRDAMEQAAAEENDHLAWCEERLRELDDHTSRLDPLWFAGSFAIGALAGLLGDRWSLGFVAETERQVVKHLESHLAQLPEGDHRTRAILEKMKEDEERHGDTASRAGGAELPEPVRRLMTLTSKVMTKTAYRF
jgi:ubiquinone biosynthesis monooxygenase Coq7